MSPAAHHPDHAPWTAGRVIGRAAGALVGVVFLIAATGKIADPLEFAKQIRQFQMIPDLYSNGLALLLPWLEALCALLLITGIWRREARVLVVLMLLVFLVAKIWAETLDLKITCGCFGSWLKAFDKATEGMPGIFMNVGLLALLAFDALADWTRRPAPRQVAAQPTA